ncbi:peroxisomal membrane protein pex14, partial [Coemansia linderi]
MSAEAQPSLAVPAQVLREDIIESAVRFLADPKVQSSTLAKKVSFLETKGLTNAEIEDALARAKSQHTTTSDGQQADGTVATRGSGPAPAYGYAQPLARPAAPPRPPLDWKDYFIAAVVAGGLGYGLYMLATKYIRPLLLARDDNRRLEEEKKLLVEQNEITRKQLESLSESTTRILDTIARQSQKTTDAIEGMASVMDKISEQEIERSSSAR